jgi:hypothetical protein
MMLDELQSARFDSKLSAVMALAFHAASIWSHAMHATMTGNSPCISLSLGKKSDGRFQARALRACLLPSTQMIEEADQGNDGGIYHVSDGNTLHMHMYGRVRSQDHR